MQPDKISAEGEVTSSAPAVLAAINAVHAAGGLAVLTDPLAHFTEVERALEPLLAALFEAAGNGEALDLEDVNGDLGLLGVRALGAFNPAERAKPYLERAVDDGAAFREVVTKSLLISNTATFAAASRAEWCKWEALVPEDVTASALNMDAFVVARHIARQWLSRDPLVVPAEPALHAVLGFRRAGLPLNRSVWRYALNGSRAGFADHAEHLEFQAERRARSLAAVAAAFAGEGA